jgi:hypothetical protein
MLKKVGSNSSYANSPEFWVYQTGHPGLIRPIAYLDLFSLKLNEGPRSPRFWNNLSDQVS